MCCIGFTAFDQIFRGSGKNQITALGTGFRSQIDYPICRTYDIWIMLHNHYAVALGKECIK